VLYSLRKDPFNATLRPYLGLALGYAQVDSAGTAIVIDCKQGADTAAYNSCIGAQQKDLTMLDPMVATPYSLKAYHSGSRFFFGPALKLMFAISNEAAVVLNVNTMLPNVTFEPTLGYEMGL
jgi:hypothetical protein